MKIRDPFVAIIGAGNVGATAAQRIIENNVADVVLHDVIEGVPQGKALDLMQASVLEGHDKRVLGTNRYEDLAGAEIVVITAGIPRKPGMAREDLILANAKVVSAVSHSIRDICPASKVIVVTNPLDLMTYMAFKQTGFDTARVFGMAGVLDSARMRYFTAEKTQSEPRRVETMVLGGHGDLMVSVTSHTRVNGKLIKNLLSAGDIDRLESRTRDGGAEIVALLKTGSAFYAPASAICEMVRSIIRDEKKLLPLCAYLAGEYGYKGIYIGVPAVLGKNGVERVVEIPLQDEERDAFKRSVGKIKEGLSELSKLGF